MTHLTLLPSTMIEQPATIAPTPISAPITDDNAAANLRALLDYCPMGHRWEDENTAYTPRVGDTVAITYQHERMTTDRIVNVQRVSPDGKAFRGYDRTYDRVRNYDMARVLTIRRIGGEGSEIAAG